MPIRATRRSRQLQGKGSTFISQLFFERPWILVWLRGLNRLVTSRSPVARSLQTELVLLQVRLVTYYDAQSLFMIKKGENMFLHLCLYVTYCRAESYVWIIVLRCDTKMYKRKKLLDTFEIRVSTIRTEITYSLKYLGGQDDYIQKMFRSCLCR